MRLSLLPILCIAICVNSVSAKAIESNFSNYHSELESSNCDVIVPTNGFEGGRQCSADYNWTVATDIIVPADKDLTIISYTPSIGMNSGTTVTSVRLRIYNNGNGVPGALLATQTIVPTSQTFKGSNFGMNFSDVLLDLDPITLEGSAGSEINYWIAIQVTTSNNTTAFIETATVGKIGAALAFSDGGNFIIPDPNKEGVYSLVAECTPMDGGNFPAPYCGPLVFSTVEPITLVKVAGIDNVSSAVVGGSSAHQDFTEVEGVMQQGETYEITLEGNTVGEYVNFFVVFIDWNQNNSLDDENEVYILEQNLFNSTGTDGKQITGQIVVPNNALFGNTRMRVKKMFGDPFDNPCTAGTSWGQVEDYTIKVEESLKINGLDALEGFSLYPNPATDVVNFKANMNIEAIVIFNLLGQKVYSAPIASDSSQIDVSFLYPGTYIIEVNVNGQLGKYKFIKN